MLKNSSYLFVLRAWSEDGRWRWSLLENGATDRVGFPSLDELYLYLASLTAAMDDEQGDDEQGDDSELDGT
jgi:hypothetical protein